MAITGGFGTTIDLTSGVSRRWVIARDGVKRWAYSGAAVDCDDCLGRGEYFTHTDDCTDDLCALNGDYHSCAGRVMRCGCMPNEQAQARARSAAE